ncbi:hypothetical protein AAEX28_09775 [Lentisphaerota bacterium WC36G]|nr:hypothetical protein LJT99_12610 [Lentisphaerae bacterium WC36]
MKNIFFKSMLAVPILISTIPAIGQTKEQIIKKSLEKINIPKNFNNIYALGTTWTEIETFKTENYPKRKRSFEYFKSNNLIYFASHNSKLISNFKDSWTQYKSNEWLYYKNEYFNYNELIDIIALLKKLEKEKNIKISQTKNKFVLTLTQKPFTKYIFNSDYFFSSMITNKTTYFYKDYKKFGTSFMPSKIIFKRKGIYSTDSEIYSFNDIQVNIKAKDYIKIPTQYKIAQKTNSKKMATYADNWQPIELMSRNLKAMRKIYGKNMNFCLHVALENSKTKEIAKLIQLTFSNKKAATEYLVAPEKNKQISQRWQNGKFVILFESKISDTTKKLIKELKTKQVTFGF